MADRGRWRRGTVGSMAVLLAAGGVTGGCAGVSGGTTAEFQHVRMGADHLPGLKALAQDASLLACVQEANAQPVPDAEALASIDSAWARGDGPAQALLGQVLGNQAADRLRRASEAQPSWLELFVIDRHGYLAAANRKTSDYWQGDEAKWSKVFVERHGEPFVDDLAYDESTESWITHYSVPMHDRQGRLVGVLVVGIRPS